MLVPVEFQGGGQVVDLGQAEVLRPDAGLGIGDVEDVVLEHPLRSWNHGGGIRCDVRQFGQMLRVVRRRARHRAHRGHTGNRAEVLLGEGLARHDQRGRAVGGGADVQQAQRVGDHRAGQHVLDGGLLAVAGIRIVQTVPGVLHLHRGEVLQRRAVEVHPAACQQCEVDGVGRPDQMEPLPVRIVLSLPADWGEEPLRGGVGADHQCHVAQPGQDLGAGGLQGLGARGAGGVTRGHRDSGPAEFLGEGGPRDETRVPVADGVGAGDELDLPPVQSGVVERRPRRDDAVLGEVASPLAPRVHARAQDVDRLGHAIFHA